MILITGGAFQGKLECARERFGGNEPAVADGTSCRMPDVLKADIWDHFSAWVRRGLVEKRDIGRELEEILESRPDIIIISQEMGCGIVPVDPFEREFRERNGRIACELAARAEEVYRVVSGVSVKIKG